MNALNWDELTDHGFTISRTRGGWWLAHVDRDTSDVGVWCETPDAALAAFPETVLWRIGFIEDRIARGACWPEEPAELAWLKKVAGVE